MAKQKGGLGQGVNALFSASALSKENKTIKEPVHETGNEKSETEKTVKISMVVPNKDQPRKRFSEEALAELTESIKVYGIVNPLIVKPNGSTYEIIAGERRWRAAQAAGLKEVPVIVREYDKQLSDEIAIIENLQREDLNPIEEANAYEQLMREYGLSQEELGKKVSKNRTTITNTLRLLKLEKSVQDMLSEGSISAGHARALLVLESGEAQKELAECIVEEKLSVREVEKRVKNFGKKKPEKKEAAKDYSIFYKEYEDRLRSTLSAKVKIKNKDNNKGCIEIDYYSQEELERIVDLIRKSN